MLLGRYQILGPLGGKSSQLFAVAAGDKVQIFDFGIAKEIPAGRPAPELTRVMDLGEMLEQSSPYASPEMLRHQRLDKRSDVWSFGCILWLLMTGSSPFAGDTPVDTMAQIVAREPNWEALPKSLPEGLRRLLERCLKKDPDQRWDDMSIVEAELTELASE